MVNYVVLGGGVAGVTCAEELSRLVGDGDQIYLLSQSRILKIVTNVQAISKTTETFDLVPTDLEQYRVKSNFHVLQGAVTHIDRQAKTLVTNAGTSYRYDKLCIATGARPRTLVDHPHVVGIRDIESVDALCSRLSAARRIMVVGNGGIALELLNEIRRIPIVWAIKDAYLGNTFLDAGASTFFMPHLFTKNEPTHSRLLPPPPQPAVPPKSPGRVSAKKPKSPSKRRASTAAVPPISSSSSDSSSSSSSSSSTSTKSATKRPRHGTALDDLRTPGASLGPVWRASLVLPPPRLQSGYSDRELVIETQVTVTAVWGPDDDDEADGRAAKRPTPTSATHDEAQAAAHAAVPRLTNPIEFVPDLTRFGEGRLGLVPRDEMRPGEVAMPFPPSAHALSSSPAAASAGGTTPAPIQTRADEWPLYVRLSNGKVYGVDLLVSATGVVPNAELAAEIGLPLASSRRDTNSSNTRTSPPPPTSAAQVAAHVEASVRPTACDGGILVDKGMRTADPDIYAAGDCVTCAWNDQSPHWFQMRLWSQARLMGLQAARSMVRDTALASNTAVAVPAPWPATVATSPPAMASPLIPPAPSAPGAPPTPFSPDMAEAAAAAAAARSPAVAGSPPLISRTC
ncbi:hypothetical protein AMAG_07694 [Allomyces macrogynus ATCC 38327]|uniref:FAD/NAD(P)-binding domain-containing protein n=1 Tax=Allomyces macrogynus (strain ATCC 38327) TaxID=578462 RepID=A0A0L0SJ14_ALLM3|nr:hypothetical protein AMAG_07694 [Allomyces macrogynus ATCC 38327]|eukprot:KNE62478.1 hypothetical protein AMAG_07694 [Allomyces macrogynus ATCC 38327]